MSKDELMLSIIEKIADDVGDLKKDTVVLLVEQAKHGQTLEANTVTLVEHEARSTASEARIERLENLDRFLRNAVIVLSSAGAFIMFLVKALPYLLHR